MFSKYFKFIRAHDDERGMTGLETAIILIAFVTVAAVFGYAVLSAGLFSAERGKETIFAGLQGAKSNLELSGSVIATSVDTTTVKTILITVKNAVAGAPIDMTPCDGTENATNKCVISLRTAQDYLKNIKWTINKVGKANANNLLETGEQFQINIDTTDLGLEALTATLGANDTFSVQVKPALGSSILVERQLPPAIEAVMDLH